MVPRWYMGGRSFFSLLWVALLAAVAVASAACGGRDAEPTVATFVLLPTPTPSPVPTLSPTATPKPTPSPSPTPTPVPTPSTSPTPSPTASPTPTPAPTPTLAPASPALTVEPDTVAQGQVVLARLTGVDAQNVSLSLAGTRYVMVREGDTWWAVVGVGALFQPGEYEATATWEGESTAAALAVVAADFGREEIELPPEASELLLDPVRIQDERQVLAVAHATFTPRRLWQGLFVMPAQGPISNPFGLMRSINGGGYIPHSGTDVVADEGAPVVAANEGQAVLARELYLFGNTVVIDHGGGVLSGYHHLSQIAVAEGQTVAKGEAIGAVGETGLVTGPHLHWEVVVHGVRVDPALWTLREVAP